MLRALVGLSLSLLSLVLAGWLAGQAVSAEPASAATPLERGAPPDAVVSYTLRASLDPSAHEVRGEGRITWKNTSRMAQDKLFVHLYLNAFKTDETRFMRARVGGFRGEARLARHGRIDVERFAVGGVDLWPAGATTPGDPADETDIEVPLTRPVAPGEEIEIEVAFIAVLPSIYLRTGFHDGFHMVAQWFPKLARLEPDGRWAHFPFERLSEFYADFGRYDVTIDVPRALVVGATGQLREEREVGERKELRFVQDAVHDFAFVAWDGFETLGPEPGEVPSIMVLYPPGYRRAAQTQLEAARRGLAYFGERYGAYPYETLTLVHPPSSAREAGGMEYPTLITTGGAWWAPLAGVRSVELVTLHELGHQWFYGLVATNESEHPFLDEGLTAYADLSASEALYGEGSLVRALGWSVATGAAYRLLSVDQVGRGPIARPAKEFPTGSEYGALVYSRTSTVLRTLARAYPGFEAGLGAYARAHRFGHPGPEDLLREVEASAGANAAEALRTALFERGWVNYRVASFGPREVVVRRDGSLSLPVEIELERESGTRERRAWDGAGEELTLEAGPGEPIVRVMIDPDRVLLCESDLLDNAASADTPELSPRVFERVAFAFASVLSLVGP